MITEIQKEKQSNYSDIDSHTQNIPPIIQQQQQPPIQSIPTNTTIDPQKQQPLSYLASATVTTTQPAALVDTHTTHTINMDSNTIPINPRISNITLPMLPIKLVKNIDHLSALSMSGDNTKENFGTNLKILLTYFPMGIHSWDLLQIWHASFQQPCPLNALHAFYKVTKHKTQNKK